MKSVLDSQSHSLGEIAATQECYLANQSESMNTWSRDQTKLVEQFNTRVNQFLLEDLKDDLPTGLFFLGHYISFATCSSELILGAKNISSSKRPSLAIVTSTLI